VPSLRLRSARALLAQESATPALACLCPLSRARQVRFEFNGLPPGDEAGSFEVPWLPTRVCGGDGSVDLCPSLGRALRLVGPASGPCSGGYEAGLVGEDYRLDAAVEVEFGEDAADVGLDGAFLEEELAGDLCVAVALGDQE